MEKDIKPIETPLVSLVNNNKIEPKKEIPSVEEQIASAKAKVGINDSKNSNSKNLDDIELG